MTRPAAGADTGTPWPGDAVTGSALTLRNGRLADRRAVDVTLRGGRIARIADADPQAPAEGAEIELGGLLLLPGLVDGHIHLDKTLTGLPWRPHIPGDGVAARVAAEKRALAEAGVPVAERAMALVRQVAAFGSTALRSHVDIDGDIGLAGLEALLALREEVRDLTDIQLVAFPQSGVLADPGTPELLDAAVRGGAEAVGGLDPGSFDGDVAGQLDIVFGIAERRGCLIDIHLHDPGALGAFQLQQIGERSRALGLQGRVAVSHAWALGAVDDETFGATAEALAAGGVAIVTNAAGAEPMPPVKRLRAAGVTVIAGSDNIRDSWSPYGSGDMLERARLIGWRSGFNTDEDLALALAMATEEAARVLGLRGYGLAEGCRADLIAVRASCVPEAVATFPPRALVVKGGRVIARDGALLAE